MVVEDRFRTAPKPLFPSTNNPIVDEALSRTLSTRVDRETEEQLRLYMQSEKVDKATAVRRLLESGMEGWRREMALRLLREDKVTVWKAAEIARLPLWDFVSLLDEKKVPLPVRGKDIIDDIRAATKRKT